MPVEGLVEPGSRHVLKGEKKPNKTKQLSKKWRTNEQRKGTKRREGTESKGLGFLAWSLSRDFSGSRLGLGAFEMTVTQNFSQNSFS